VYWYDDQTGQQVFAAAYSGQGGGSYIYPWNNGVFYRVAGDVGYRSLVISWYAGTNYQGFVGSKQTLFSTC